MMEVLQISILVVVICPFVFLKLLERYTFLSVRKLYLHETDLKQNRKKKKCLCALAVLGPSDHFQGKSRLAEEDPRGPASGPPVRG